MILSQCVIFFFKQKPGRLKVERKERLFYLYPVLMLFCNADPKGCKNPFRLQ